MTRVYGFDNLCECVVMKTDCNQHGGLNMGYDNVQNDAVNIEEGADEMGGSEIVQTDEVGIVETEETIDESSGVTYNIVAKKRPKRKRMPHGAI